MIGSLPPIVGSSLYTSELIKRMGMKIPISFLGFRNIYPRVLYRGEIYDITFRTVDETQRIKIRNVLDCSYQMEF